MNLKLLSVCHINHKIKIHFVFFLAVKAHTPVPQHQCYESKKKSQVKMLAIQQQHYIHLKLFNLFLIYYKIIRLTFYNIEFHSNWNIKQTCKEVSQQLVGLSGSEPFLQGWALLFQKVSTHDCGVELWLYISHGRFFSCIIAMFVRV